MLTDEKIKKLRELAERGVDGEKDNARRILANNNIDWRKPKESIVNKIKDFVNVEIRREYVIHIRNAGDVFIIHYLNDKYINKNKRDIKWSGSEIRIWASEAECEKIEYILSRASKDITAMIAQFLEKTLDGL